MNVTKSGQLHAVEIGDLEFDLALCACGYEARASHAARQVKVAAGGVKLTLPFRDQKDLSRTENEAIFAASGFASTIEIENGDFFSVATLFSDAIRKTVKSKADVLRVFIDYSCMTKAWYGAIIHVLFAEDFECVIKVVFGYSVATFSAPECVHVNTVVTPLVGFVNLAPVSKPVALVIGLGYEKIKAVGLTEYLDPARTVAFYTDPAYDARFVDVVRRNNASFLAGVRSSSVYMHPLMDMDLTADMLFNVVGGLEQQFRIVVAPLGVKPFGLLSMLLSARFHSCDVWRVSGDRFGKPSQREAAGPILLYEICFAP